MTLRSLADVAPDLGVVPARAGHATGFPQHLLTEDLAVVTSMKPIVDRTKEQLNAADAAIVNVRRSVLAAVNEFVRGETPACARFAEIDERHIVPQSDFVPAGTPANIVARLNGDIDKADVQAEFRERIANAGFDPVGGTQQEFARYVREEVSRWGKIVRATGAQVE